MVVAGALLIQGFDYTAADLYSSLLALGAATVFAVVGRFERYGINPINGAGMIPSAFAYACGVLATVGVACILYAKTGTIYTAVPIIEHILTVPHLVLFVAVAGVAANWLNMAALVDGEIVEVSAMLRLGVLATMFSGWWFFGEDISDRLHGGAVLFAGVLLVTLPLRRAAKK